MCITTGDGYVLIYPQEEEVNTEMENRKSKSALKSNFQSACFIPEINEKVAGHRVARLCKICMK